MKYIKTALIIVIIGLAISLEHPAVIRSANLGNTKDTLQTSRLSVNARVNGALTVAGSSIVYLKTSGAAPANTVSTSNLHDGDSLTIGSNPYTILTIIDDQSFTISPVIAGPDAADNTPIYLIMKPRHVVTFTTSSAVANGFFQVLLPADATTPNDGNPDDQGFDFGGGTVDVVAVATSSANYTFVTGVATPSGGTGCTAPANYHCFEVHYSGSGAVGASITIFIGNTGGTGTPIAPAPSPSHTEAISDNYSFLVKQFASGNNPNVDLPIDQTSGQTSFIEAVRVTATVEPSITFRIDGVAASQTRCGVSTDVSTSVGNNAPLVVPFGSLTLNAFKNAAHTLTVSTNAAYGYAVTAIENDQLGKDGGTTPFIPDTPCDSGPCTNTSSQEWATATNNGFGYAIQLGTAATVSATYAGYNEFARTFSALEFPATSELEPPQQVMGSSTVANAETATVCYRISVGATQAAGDYENQITYTATATF